MRDQEVSHDVPHTPGAADHEAHPAKLAAELLGEAARCKSNRAILRPELGPVAGGGGGENGEDPETLGEQVEWISERFWMEAQRNPKMPEA